MDASISRTQFSQLHPPYHHATLPFVAANSAIGPENPARCRRKAPPNPICRRFFSPIISCNGGCAWETFGSAGFLYLRFLSLRTAATHSPENERGSSHLIWEFYR
ncbi:hypothetical protein EUX57_06430 [Pseudomonas orientalis]|uniref:Uncharacterized protein n=1 Tax=Pseudomonas orientalis TaxID=76758 RepID=A0A4Q7D3Q6_9PSED|nr:hypothetical protein EUX57_06430 [Pseudomonas orientalis]